MKRSYHNANHGLSVRNSFPIQTALTGKGELSRGESYAFASLSATIFRRKWVLGAVFVVPIIFSAILSNFVPTIYKAEARLLALSGREYVASPGGGESSGGITLDIETITKSEAEILQSPSVHEQVVKKIRPEVLYPKLADSSPSKLLESSWFSSFLDRLKLFGLEKPSMQPSLQASSVTILGKALMAFGRDLRVEPIRGTSVIMIAFEHSDRELATRAVTELIEQYFARRLKILSPAYAAALAGPYSDVTTRLENADRELDRYTRESGVIDLNQELNILIQQRATLEVSERAAASELAQAREGLAEYRRMLAATPREIKLHTDNTPVTSYDSLKINLFQLEAERASLVSTLFEKHPKVVALDQQIARLKAEAARTPQTKETSRFGINPLLEEIQSQIARQESRVVSLQRLVETLTAQSADLNARAEMLRASTAQHRALSREQSMLLETQKIYAKRLEEARILDKLSQNRSENVRLIQPALPPIEGKSLKSIILALGLITGAVASIFMAFMLEAVRTVFVIPRDAIYTLGLPALATIPALSQRDLQSKNRLADLRRFDSSDKLSGKSDTELFITR